MKSKEVSVRGKIIELDDFHFAYEFRYDDKTLKTKAMARNINIDDIEQEIRTAILFYKESAAKDNFLEIKKRFNNTEITVGM